MICLYGVCVPLNMLLPFLVGLLHRYGYLKFIKEEWFTISYWKLQYNRWISGDSSEKKPSAPGTSKSSTEGAKQELKQDLNGVNVSVDKAVARKKQEDGRDPKRRHQAPKADGPT